MTAIDDLKELSSARRWAKTGVARIVRERAELTQAEIAEACGVDQSTVALWEKGERTPGGEPAKTYARALVGLAVSFPGGIAAIEKEVASKEARDDRSA